MRLTLHPGDTLNVNNGALVVVVEIKDKPTGLAEHLSDLQAESDRYFRHAQDMQRAAALAQESASRAIAEAEAARGDLKQVMALLREVDAAAFVGVDVLTDASVIRVPLSVIRNIRKAVRR